MRLRKTELPFGKIVILTLFMTMFLSLSITKTYAAGNWEIEDNDSRTSANSIALNDVRSGSISDYGDEDYYKITTNEQGVLTIRFTHEYVASESDYWYVELQDAEGDGICTRR